MIAASSHGAPISPSPRHGPANVANTNVKSARPDEHTDATQRIQARLAVRLVRPHRRGASSGLATWHWYMGSETITAATRNTYTVVGVPMSANPATEMARLTSNVLRSPSLATTGPTIVA